MSTPDTVFQAAATVWAKSFPYDVPPDHWQPLWQHLDDTADVAGRLWDEWLAPGLRQLISDGLPDGEADGRRLLVWLAGSHDIGKATPAFAVQVGSLQNVMAEVGLTAGPMVLVDRSKLRHEVAGAAILERWLEECFDIDPRGSRQFTDVVAGHHGAYPLARAVIAAHDQRELLGSGLWIEVQNFLTERAATRAEVMDRLPHWQRARLSPAAQMELTGLVVMADWIASSSEYFPLVPVRELPAIPHPDTVLNRRRVDRAWRRLNLGVRWAPQVPTGPLTATFNDRFPATGGHARPVQEAAARLARTMSAQGLMIIEAPMGEGKTEAALLAAEVLAARAGCNGCFVALPTQATSNAMFSRVLQWMERLPQTAGADADDQSISLVHGKSALNDEFTTLRFGGDVVGISGEDKDSPEWDEKASRVHATVHEWMTGRKRAALSSFVVGTIDQVLFGSLLARHVMLRQLSLASKVVIIDEVHSYDVYMGTFLDRALEWLGASGTPVVLLSATLPASRRADLYAAYDRGSRRLRGLSAEVGATAASRGALIAPLGYPSIITTTDEGPEIEVLEPSGRSSTIALHRLDDDLEVLGALLKERLHEGGNAVVIRNTVSRVQETAAYLTAIFGDDAVMVAHAQFLAADRLINDAELLHRLGPPGPGVERPRGPWIVVASQVVEQSLDVDFDLMVTDVAPVDLVLQRMGRLHRHVRTDRPGRLTAPECYLTGVDWSHSPPGLDRGGRAVYGAWPLYRALAVLADRSDGGAVTLPEDIPLLVQAAYNETAAVPEDWGDAVARAWTSFSDRAARRRSAAESHALPEVGAISNLYNLSRGSAGAIDEDSPQGQATVRDGGESVEVVVVQRGADGIDRIPDWVEGGGQTLPMRHVPLSHEDARALARCTLRLPFRLVRGGLFDVVVGELEQDWFEGWQRTPLLSGQLAMVLDDDASRLLAGHRVRYDQRIGLVVVSDEV